MEFSLLICLVGILLILQFFGSYNKTVSKATTNNKDKELETIKDLKKQIEIIQDDNARTLENIFNEKDLVFIKSDTRWNFGNSAIPSILIDENLTVADANTRFYKVFENTEFSTKLKGKALKELIPYFDTTFKNLVERVEFVLDTGQGENVDTLEVEGQMVTLFRVYITRCKIDYSTYVLLQFIKFPVAPMKFHLPNDIISLGIWKDSNRPIILVDDKENIIDIGGAAIEYFTNHDMTVSGKKLYQIFPELTSKDVLEEYAKANSVVTPIYSDEIKTPIHVNKLSIDVGTFYGIVILDGKSYVPKRPEIEPKEFVRQETNENEEETVENAEEITETAEEEIK